MTTDLWLVVIRQLCSLFVQFNMETYSFKTTIQKGIKYLVLFALPVLVDKLIISYPEIAQLSVGAILVMAVNMLKVKYGFNPLKKH